jgi:hypothetical protein
MAKKRKKNQSNISKKPRILVLDVFEGPRVRELPGANLTIDLAPTYFASEDSDGAILRRDFSRVVLKFVNSITGWTHERLHTKSQRL